MEEKISLFIGLFTIMLVVVVKVWFWLWLLNWILRAVSGARKRSEKAAPGKSANPQQRPEEVARS